MFHGRAAFRHQFVRVFVAEFVEGEGAALGDLDCAVEQLGPGGVAAGDFVAGAQVAFGVGEEPAAGFGERALFADAGEDVLEIAAFGDVVVDGVGGDEGDAEAAGEIGELVEPIVIRLVEGEFGGEVEAVGEEGEVGSEGARERGIEKGRDGGTEGHRDEGRDDGYEAFGVVGQVGEVDFALALGCAELAVG